MSNIKGMLGCEALFVVKGRLRMKLFDEEGNSIESSQLLRENA